MPTLTPSITAHMNNTNNPHNVTAAQTGAIPTTEKGAANGVATLDAVGKLVQMPTTTDIGAEPANANIQAHIASTANPHNVTPAQIGAASLDANNEVVQLPAGAAAAALGSFLLQDGTWGKAVSVVKATYNLSTGGATLAITGAGFAPSAVIIHAAVNGVSERQSIGISLKSGTSAPAWQQCIFSNASGLMSGNTAQVVRMIQAGGNSNTAVVSTFDADGITLSWTQAGTPTAATASLACIFIR